MVTFNKIGKVIGVFGGLSSLIGIISIVFFNQSYSYLVIFAGIISCFLLLNHNLLK